MVLERAEDVSTRNFLGFPRRDRAGNQHDSNLFVQALLLFHVFDSRDRDARPWGRGCLCHLVCSSAREGSNPLDFAVLSGGFLVDSGRIPVGRANTDKRADSDK